VLDVGEAVGFDAVADESPAEGVQLYVIGAVPPVAVGFRQGLLMSLCK
jgi:hypothetical protein